MTLAQIYRLALRQLDEDPEDMSEFRDLFKEYVNEAYKIAVHDYLKPRRTFNFVTDDKGRIDVTGLHIYDIISVTSDNFGFGLHASMTPERDGIQVYGGIAAWDQPVTVLARVEYPPLVEDTDEPKLPLETHMALVDYICYRYKMTGNLAKQSQGQMFLQRFQDAMMRIPREGHGSVIHAKNLYESTSLLWPW